MAFRICPIPSNTKTPVATVTVCDTVGGRKLSISREAVERSSLKPRDALLMERDDQNPDLFRVRRCQGDEPVFGVLSVPKSEKSGSFSTGGRIVLDAGYTAGIVAAECGDGWIQFDAAPLKPQAWTLKIAPDDAVDVVRGLLAGHDQRRIIDQYDVTGDDVNAARRLVGEARIAELKALPEPARERQLGRELDRWRLMASKGGADR